ncbi:hypothetical protein [Dactylosporangium sp. NPDC049140]|uniref:hypothetical protein n=1 Tax=Dactylosporangium sp. NPDC049140 TaxID=3155647 RepID=UPI003404A518
MLFGIASAGQARLVMRNAHVQPYGVVDVYPHFAAKTLTLAGLANGSGGFYEIYNFGTGAPDGGWQTGSHRGALADQTWSATAYLRMVYSGLLGLQFTTAGLAFPPDAARRLGRRAALRGALPRGVLDIALHGAGNVVTDLRVDGVPTTARPVPSTLTATHTVDVTLAGGAPGPVRGYDCNGTAAQRWFLPG